jgi:glycosyltransferase involved in cell wall biosynthesis
MLVLYQKTFPNAAVSGAVQAAAHGVPTVATKNGGPVDIMATLHHGLVVDPTNSKQIADALLKILTNPEVWDEMSHNGARLAASLENICVLGRGVPAVFAAVFC